MKTPAPMTISDREIALKLADLTADNKDGFGFAFYNASLVRFAIEIANWRDEQWRRANMSFAQLYPPNPDATCKCEHWQYCAECHPTAPQPSPTPPPAKVELFNPLEGGNPETALQMAAVIALRDSQPARGYPPLPEPQYQMGGKGHSDAAMRAYVDADRAARAPANSVLEDAGGANWQDISTAPKDGTRFVAVGQNYGLDSETQHTCIAQWLAGCWIEVSDWNGASKLKYLTHWMPLPPLPGSAARAPADSVTAPARPSKPLPYEPTSAMLIAARERDPALPIETVRAIYWSMWRTAPTPPAQAADSVLEDAARLDWLALAGPVSICVVIDRPHDGEVEVATDDVTGYGKTLREAIDAAMKKGGAT